MVIAVSGLLQCCLFLFIKVCFIQEFSGTLSNVVTRGKNLS
jgi:hypothetical protein